MEVGLIGAGNMASALARGWRQPVYVADPMPERAARLAHEVGGTVCDSNADVATSADLVVLCHKPAQLDDVAREITAEDVCVASILGGVSVSELERAYPERPVYRFMPNIAVELGRGVLCYSPGRLAARGPEGEVLELFAQVGTVLAIDDHLMDAATALTGCAPAFFALVVEALADAGVGCGLQYADAVQMASETMAGAAAELAVNENDTVGLRRRVTSPGGSTARGLAALERGGVRAAVNEAVAAVCGRQRA